MTTSWFDARGCLSPDGVRALRSAPPGGAPAELAAHLASCGSCQQRLLVLESGPRKPRADADPARPWRNLVLIVLALAVMFLGMFTTVCRVG